MKKSELLAAGLCALVAMPALGEEGRQDPVTANASLVTNYVFRGISRSGANPAVQAGFDYANPNGGLYIGVWGSSISWLSDAGKATGAGSELNTYLGIKNDFAKDFTYDFGFVRYNYFVTYKPGAIVADTKEIYAGLGYQWLAFKYSYSFGDTFGITQSKGSHYVDVSANYPIPDSGVTLGAHYGRQTYEGAVANGLKAAGTDPSYADYKVSISWNYKGYVFGAAASKTNAKNGGYYTYTNASGQPVNLGKYTSILSLSRTF